MLSPHPSTVHRATGKRLVDAQFYRAFHDYFVTHLPSSSLHPDSRSSSSSSSSSPSSSPGPHHQLPRSASKPHDSTGGPSPAPLLGNNRDTTVVRIPLRSAKHHFGVSLSRGDRPYNEDAYQAGVIDLPAFATRVPLTITRAPASSPLQAYREGQLKKQNEARNGPGNGEATAAEGAGGDPQVFYFAVFDGHGGAKCSGYLREKLHESIEGSAKAYGLGSTLSGHKQTTTVSEIVESPSSKAAPSSDSTAPSSTDPVTNLTTTLLTKYRTTIGGYFSRFLPSPLHPPTSSMPTVLTHAFLSLDLSFLTTQLRLATQLASSMATDAPINVHDSLSSPSIAPQKPFQGGSTASIALISTPTPTPFWHPSTPATLYTAHVGDTRILLCRVSDGAAVSMTTNHHPSAPSEAARLRRFAGAFVTDSFGEERMSGLANTRAFGDMASKRLGVSAEPEIRRLDLKPSEFSFVILISDGVTGSMSDQEIVDVVKEAKTPEEGAREVVAYATEVGEGGDNATAVVVRMGGWERRGEGCGGGMGTREERGWRRREAEEGRGRSDRM